MLSKYRNSKEQNLNKRFTSSNIRLSLKDSFKDHIPLFNIRDNYSSFYQYEIHNFKTFSSISTIHNFQSFPSISTISFELDIFDKALWFTVGDQPHC